MSPQREQVSIPATVVDLHDVFKAETDENCARKDFLPSEMVAIGREIGERERREAQKRQERRPICSGKLPEQNLGDTRDRVASYLGVSGKTYEKAKAVGTMLIEGVGLSAPGQAALKSIKRSWPP